MQRAKTRLVVIQRLVFILVIVQLLEDYFSKIFETMCNTDIDR